MNFVHRKTFLTRLQELDLTLIWRWLKLIFELILLVFGHLKQHIGGYEYLLVSFNPRFNGFLISLRPKQAKDPIFFLFELEVWGYSQLKCYIFEVVVSVPLVGMAVQDRLQNCRFLVKETKILMSELNQRRVEGPNLILLIVILL